LTIGVKWGKGRQKRSGLKEKVEEKLFEPRSYEFPAGDLTENGVGGGG
jgi:hypothetical protein